MDAIRMQAPGLDRNLEAGTGLVERAGALRHIDLRLHLRLRDRVHQRPPHCSTRDAIGRFLQTEPRRVQEAL